MRTIIAGSRNITNYGVVASAMAQVLKEGMVVSKVLCGGASGVDSNGAVWADRAGVVVEYHPADWSKGKGAGMLRNCAMAKAADALVAIWDGKSRGTGHMINEATRRGLRVWVFDKMGVLRGNSGG